MLSVKTKPVAARVVTERHTDRHRNRATTVTLTAYA